MTPLIFPQLRLPTLNLEHLNWKMKIQKQLSSLRRIPSNKEVSIATHWSYRSNDHEMHLQLLPTCISHWWIQHAQQCTFTWKLHPSMWHDIWNSKLTLYIIVPKKKDIVYDLSTYTLFCLMLLFVLYAPLYFFVCYRFMFYVSFSLRFGLHCFYPKSFLKNGRIVMYITNLGFFL